MAVENRTRETGREHEVERKSVLMMTYSSQHLRELTDVEFRAYFLGVRVPLDNKKCGVVLMHTGSMLTAVTPAAAAT